MKKQTEEERKKRVEEISKHLHPHDDEPDPTAYMPWFCYYVCSICKRDRKL